MRQKLGPVIGNFHLTVLPPDVPAMGGSRLWLPPDLMFALKLSAGTLSAVGLACTDTVESSCVPLSLQTVFQQRLGITPSENVDQKLGDLVVIAELWPAPRLPKSLVAASPLLRDALGRPEPGSQLVLFELPAALEGPSRCSLHCATIYLRLCASQGTFASYPATLPTDNECGTLTEGGRYEEGASSHTNVPTATPAISNASRSQVTLSPAMRSAGRQPVALSPAMRGAANTPPALLSPSSNPRKPPSPQACPSARTPRSSGRGDRAKPAQTQALNPLQCAALSALLHTEGSERVRGLVENMLLRVLCGRRILPGNFVTAPILGHQALFRVDHINYRSEVSLASATPGPWPCSVDQLVKCGQAQHEQCKASAGHVGLGFVSSSKPEPLAVGLQEALVVEPLSLTAGVRLLAPGEPWDAVVADLGMKQRSAAGGHAQAAAQAAAHAVGGGLEGAAATAAFRAAAAGARGGGMAFSSLGGASGPKQALCELVVLPLKAPHLFAHYQVTPPRGVLLYGPPGTGKTVLARAAAADANANLFVINGPDVVSEYFGDSEAGLRGVFAAAKAVAPSVIFIDELDAIAPLRGGAPGMSAGSSSVGGVTGRLVTALLLEMDGLVDSPVVLIAATNRPDALDSALRRPGRFDREVEVGVPTPSDRREILCVHLARMRHTLTSQQITNLADIAHGFTAADLGALCNEAALAALRRLRRIKDSGSASAGEAGHCVTLGDFAAAETRVRPSAMREVSTEIPKIKWEDVGGLDEVKQRLKEAVEWPFKSPAALGRLGAQPPKGILLHGPPGCSKTLLARAVASQAKLNFLAIKGPELYSKYVGESEKAVAILFARARAASPSIVFIDELDGLASTRQQCNDGSVSVGDRVLSQLLQEMDGLQVRRNVIVIGATNRLDAIDPALVRPGRFDQLLHIPPPSEGAREAIFKVHTRNTPLASDVDLRQLAMLTEGFSGADVMALCKEACLAALEREMGTMQVAMQDFTQAWCQFEPTFKSIIKPTRRGLCKA